MNSRAIELNAGAATTEGRSKISLSRYVNEQLPEWHNILTAHDVARLTRRPSWFLTGLALLKRFPKKRRFRGRDIGWHKSDILEWIARTRDLETPIPQPEPAQPFKRSKQQFLPFECTSACIGTRRRASSGHKRMISAAALLKANSDQCEH